MTAPGPRQWEQLVTAVVSLCVAAVVLTLTAAICVKLFLWATG